MRYFIAFILLTLSINVFAEPIINIEHIIGSTRVAVDEPLQAHITIKFDNYENYNAFHIALTGSYGQTNQGIIELDKVFISDSNIVSINLGEVMRTDKHMYDGIIDSSTITIGKLEAMKDDYIIIMVDYHVVSDYLNYNGKQLELSVVAKYNIKNRNTLQNINGRGRSTISTHLPMILSVPNVEFTITSNNLNNVYENDFIDVTANVIVRDATLVNVKLETHNTEYYNIVNITAVDWNKVISSNNYVQRNILPVGDYDVIFTAKLNNVDYDTNYDIKFNLTATNLQESQNYNVTFTTMPYIPLPDDDVTEGKELVATVEFRLAMNIAAITDIFNFKNEIINNVANSLNIDRNNIQIINIKPGSVVVTLMFTSSTVSTIVKQFLQQIENSASSLRSTALFSNYVSGSVSATYKIAILCEDGLLYTDIETCETNQKSKDNTLAYLFIGIFSALTGMGAISAGVWKYVQLKGESEMRHQVARTVKAENGVAKLDRQQVGVTYKGNSPIELVDVNLDNKI